MALTLLCAALFLPAVASAQPYVDRDPAVVSQSTVPPGGSVTISGAGFEPGSRVTITIESAPQTLAVVNADSSGAISVTVRIPSDMSPGAHTINAIGVTPDGERRVLSQHVTVADTDETPDEEVAEAPAGTETAEEPTSVLVPGGLLVVAALGGVLFLAHRRKRRAKADL